MTEELEVKLEDLTGVKFNFGIALEYLKQGKCLTREGWNGQNLFVFMQVPSEIPITTVPNMQSLPQDVKDVFTSRFASEISRPKDVDANMFNHIRYRNQFCIVTETNMIYGWVPSGSDALANDWKIFKT